MDAITRRVKGRDQRCDHSLRGDLSSEAGVAPGARVEMDAPIIRREKIVEEVDN